MDDEGSQDFFSNDDTFQMGNPATRPSESPSVQHAGLQMTWAVELYANIYLAHVHKLYPFLRETDIRSWLRTCARGQPLKGDYKGFILRLLCAIGAFMCSSFAEDCSHLEEAVALTREAFDKFHAGAMREGALVRSQVCLIVLHHAIYGPQPERVHKALAAAMAACAQILEPTNRDVTQRPFRISSEGQPLPQMGSEDDDTTEDVKNIVLACHQTNEIIACGWDTPPESLSPSLDSKVSPFHGLYSFGVI